MHPAPEHRLFQLRHFNEVDASIQSYSGQGPEVHIPAFLEASGLWA